MGEVISARDRLSSMSISRLAEGFGMARETVAKRLAEAGVAASGKRDGYPVYSLRDAAEAILEIRGHEGQTDPSKLKPMERRAWFQSENERLKFEQDQGNLILASEVHSEMAAIAKIIVRFLETLPDTIERDLRCGPEVVEYLLRKVRGVRTEIAVRIADDEEQDVRESA